MGGSNSFSYVLKIVFFTGVILGFILFFLMPFTFYNTVEELIINPIILIMSPFQFIPFMQNLKPFPFVILFVKLGRLQ